MSTWLVLDCNYLVYRSLYAFISAGLESNGVPTGVLYGFLKDVRYLQDQFSTNNVAFCWDHGESLRTTIYPRYKHERRTCKLSTIEMDAFVMLRKQVKALKFEILPNLGFRNILFQKGYEADDVIASFVQQSLPHGTRAVIVSADQDLYQLITKNVCCFNPRQRKTTSLELFRQEYGIDPAQWHCAKAIAGCKSDGVKGVNGVGDITACKFLRGIIKEGTPTYQKILAAEKTWKQNLKLVRLPYPGIKRFKVKKDMVTDETWQRECERLGFPSLLKRQIVREKEGLF